MIKITYFYDNFFLRFFLKANLAFHSLPETTNHESGLVNEIQSNPMKCVVYSGRTDLNASRFRRIFFFFKYLNDERIIL